MKLERAYAASLSRCALIARSILYSSVRKRYAVRTELASGSKLGSLISVASGLGELFPRLYMYCPVSVDVVYHFPSFLVKVLRASPSPTVTFADVWVLRTLF